jgi:hypothetical protein
MADTDKNTVDSSTAGGSTPEVQESNNHQLTQALQRIARAQLELSHTIETMQADIAKGRVPKVGHDVMLTLVRTSIATTKTLTEMVAGSLPTEQHFHLPRFNKASEALHIPEIAENILSHLGVKDLLRVAQVDWKIYNIIQGSPVLQKNLFLKSRLTGPFAILPSIGTVLISTLRTGVPFSFEYRQNPLFDRVTAVVDDHAMNTISGVHPTRNTGSMILCLESGYRLIEGALGPKVQSMFVCQPPVHVMQVTMFCSNCKRPDMKAPKDNLGNFVLKAEQGITIGHVMEVTKTLRKLHHSCWSTMRDRVVKKNREEKHPLPADRLFRKFPHAQGYDFWPHFYTMGKLEQDDPILLRWREEFKKIDAEDAEQMIGIVGMYNRTSCLDREDTDNYV